MTLLAASSLLNALDSGLKHAGMTISPGQPNTYLSHRRTNLDFLNLKHPSCNHRQKAQHNVHIQ